MRRNANTALKANFNGAVARVFRASRTLSGVAEVGHLLASEFRTSRTNAARELFAALDALVQLYNAPQNWAGNCPREAMPIEVMQIIGGLFGYLAVGKIPEPINDVKGAGQTKPGRTEQNDIKIAGTYVAAARAGKISDKAPIQKIMAKFGVGKRTAEGWAKEGSVPEDENLEALARRMERAGQRYLENGRSQAAVTKRHKTKRAKSSGDTKQKACATGRPVEFSSYEEYVATIDRDELSREDRIADIEDALGK